MDETAINVPASLVAYIPAITILLQFLKSIPALEKVKAYFPLFAVVLGIIVGFFAMPAETEVVVKIVGGIVLGIGSSGLYSGVKSAGILNSSNEYEDDE